MLGSTLNTRALQKGTLKLIRSDAPNNLSKDEIQWLLQNDITTIVDLRDGGEVKRKPCPLLQNSEFTYFHIPVSGGNIIPKSSDMVSLVYLQMVDDVMWNIISTIENAKTNVLYFCNAGKDRTGVVSALLLLRMGASRAEIINDYLLSAGNLKKMLKDYVACHPEVDIEVITPKKRYMEEFLDNLRL